MGRGLAAAAAVTVCIYAAGCGGSSSEPGSPSPTAAVEQQTAATQGQTAPPASPRPSGGSPTPTPVAPETALPRQGTFERRLAPFRECLSRHGVDLTARNGSGADLRNGSGADLRASPDRPDFTARIRAGIACIPELPPRLRERAEKLKRRFERRNG
jgi:hypothetical protein